MQATKQFVVVDAGCNVLWCGQDLNAANETAQQIEREFDREVTVRERTESDLVPNEVVV